MQTIREHPILSTSGAICLASVGLGWFFANVLLMALGVAGAGYTIFRLASGKSLPDSAAGLSADEVIAAPRPVPACASHNGADPDDIDALVELMLAQGRFTLLLRPQIARNLQPEQFARAMDALQAGMALVPDGDVMLGQSEEPPDDGEPDEEDATAQPGRMVRVQRLFLDRYPVTNRIYFEFVAGGGYEQMSFWDEAIWPAVLDFVDRSGAPGPRFWVDGCYLQGQENHPVVGVSWYEAVAYARWVGKRLPTDAEWVKAGSWPVPVSDTVSVQRKYPWGDSMDRKLANLWGSGLEGIVDVDQFADGVSVGGVYQLIGNVWEWTSSNYRAGEHPAGTLTLEVPMKSIRGGAFDTYFDNQATCQFQSGETSIARRHNVSFRLAVGVCDLALAQPAASPPPPDAEVDQPTAEEVSA